MRTLFLRGLAVVVLVFLVIFAARLGYGYLAFPDQSGEQLFAPVGGDEGDFEVNRKNYASLKWQAKTGLDPSPGTLDQKYEKIGLLSSRTGVFDDDEKRLRDLVGSYSALIQFEQMGGLPGSRILKLGIGVVPARFDRFLEEAKKIGTLNSFRVQKIDKTHEFKGLQVKRTSLEKAREALLALKGKEGRIEELVELEKKILEIEGEIQCLGIQLGDFDLENEFCTVKCTLMEGSFRTNRISLLHRSYVALEWTAMAFFGLLLLVFGTSVTLLVVIVLIQKLPAGPPPPEKAG